MDSVRCVEKNTFLHFELQTKPTVRPRCLSDMTDVRDADGFDRLESAKQAWKEFAIASELPTVEECPPSPRTPDYKPSSNSSSLASLEEEEEEAAVLPPSCPRTPECTYHAPDKESPSGEYYTRNVARYGNFPYPEQRAPADMTTPAAYLRERPQRSRGPVHAEITSPLEDDVTLMLRNIPNKYTQDLLLDHIKKYASAIDFFYLPIDFKKNCNLGYAFLNFSHGRAADAFAAEFNQGRLPSFRKSPKVLAVQKARVQGVDANVKKFRSSAVMGSMSNTFKPMLFVNGQQVEFPKPEGALPPIGTRYQRTPGRVLR